MILTSIFKLFRDFSSTPSSDILLFLGLLKIGNLLILMIDIILTHTSSTDSRKIADLNMGIKIKKDWIITQTLKCWMEKQGSNWQVTTCKLSFFTCTEILFKSQKHDWPMKQHVYVHLQDCQTLKTDKIITFRI